VWWHRGRCLSYGDGVAFWALAEVVRQRLGIAEEDPVTVAAAKLAEGLDRFVPDPAEQAYTGLRLGRLLGVTVPGDSGGPLSREELFAGWRLFFERLATQAPVVLLIEDAQYADVGLLDFLDHLIDWGRDLPVFVLVLARPELGQTRPGFGAGRNRITLALDPLDPASMGQLVDALVPGMPAPARAAVTGQAQGIPLFAVETVRALIDRDIVQPVEGSYRLVGDVGQLAVPDSLHALLASRLDALDPKVRRLVTVAAVLGATFSAEALVAVSSRDEDRVRVALAELVRREVLAVSADPLSPERGNYQFAQQMLRQVAYDTLSRRDRKTLHLKVADHLRTAFANDGEEVADVIARHYLDALTAVPDDEDAAGIRGQAVAALLRAAERAERTGAPAQAATSYGTAAQLSEDAPDGPRAAADGAPAVGMMWERAAEAATDSGDWAVALAHANRARDYYQQDGQLRAAARAQARAGLVLQRWGRLAEAREQLTSALEVLRDDPDRDTVIALEQLAAVSVFAGAPEAERLTTEALSLGQALGTGKLSDPLVTRGIYLTSVGRRIEAIAYFREAARLSEQAGDTTSLGRVLVNLSDALAYSHPAAAAEAAHSAVGHLRRTGARDLLAVAITNEVGALISLGDWDGAEDILGQAVDADGLADFDFLECYRGWVAALRGDAATAETLLAALGDLRDSEDPQDRSLISVVAAFAADARGEHSAALRHSRATIEQAAYLSINHDCARWAWPLAARIAYQTADNSTTRELLTMLDSSQPGHLVPMLSAERDLVSARLAAQDGDPAATAALAAAVSRLRELSTPYHLAHGLLDQAQHLLRQGDTETAAGAVEEARSTATSLRCQPLLARAAAITAAEPRIPA
jgi:tetratricopeptide (TPR) repeat protein